MSLFGNRKPSARFRAPRFAQRRRLWIFSVGAACLMTLGVVGARMWLTPSRSRPSAASLQELATLGSVHKAEAAITRMDLEEAERALRSATGPEAARARARLAIYRADCEGGAAQLSAGTARSASGAEELRTFAERCAGATVNGHVVEDRARGIWIRFQDGADKVLAPLLMNTIARARDVIEADLGSQLPLPLRIDLVRDLFSLSAVSGLPLEAAETTGTVAVARWGRVTMISPRAMARGYPWQDTMAHEITHLVLSRATADRAPLWLQEGVAKREETRWRPRRPFDRIPEPAEKAYRAQVSGTSVGVDRLGPSIAMLPTADAAAIAFAEVTSFVEYWLEQNGEAALPALLRDVQIANDTERALWGVSGLGLAEWQLRWRSALEQKFGEPSQSQGGSDPPSELGPREMARVQRLVELLFVHGYADEARERGAPELDRAPHSATLRFLVARSAFAAGQDDAPGLLGPLENVDGAHGGFLALLGRAARSPSVPIDDTVGDPTSVSTPASGAGQNVDADAVFEHALALDPLLPEVACEGVPWHQKSLAGAAPARASPADDAKRSLCEHTRSLPVRGAH